MAYRYRRSDDGSAWLWVIGGIIVLLLLALFLVPFFDSGEGTTAGPNLGVTLCDVTDNPQEFYGNTVTVSGEVSEVRSADALVLGGDDFIGGCRVLVVGVNPIAQLIGDDVDLGDRPAGEVLLQRDVVQVTGTMRRFDIAEFEEEIGADLNDEQFAEFEGKPALVARQIFLNPRVSKAAEPPRAQGGATLADINDNPEEFFGDTVTVDGIVAETIEPTVFAIVSPGDEALAEEEEFTAINGAVLVANTAGGGVNLKEGMTVQVTGTIIEFDLAEVEEAVGDGLDDVLYTEWSGRPTILAKQVQTK